MLLLTVRLFLLNTENLYSVILKEQQQYMSGNNFTRGVLLEILVDMSHIGDNRVYQKRSLEFMAESLETQMRNLTNLSTDYPRKKKVIQSQLFSDCRNTQSNTSSLPGILALSALVSSSILI